MRPLRLRAVRQDRAVQVFPWWCEAPPIEAAPFRGRPSLHSAEVRLGPAAPGPGARPVVASRPL